MPQMKIVGQAILLSSAEMLMTFPRNSRPGRTLRSLAGWEEGKADEAQATQLRADLPRPAGGGSLRPVAYPSLGAMEELMCKY